MDDTWAYDLCDTDYDQPPLLWITEETFKLKRKNGNNSARTTSSATTEKTKPNMREIVATGFMPLVYFCYSSSSSFDPHLMADH